MAHNLTSHNGQDPIIAKLSGTTGDPGKDPLQLNCEAKGGRWEIDPGTGKGRCILPKTSVAEEVRPGAFRTTRDGKEGVIENGVFFEDDPGAEKFGVLRHSETGRLSGFTRGERTLTGLSPKEVRTLAEKEAGLQELTIGGQAEQVLTARQKQLQETGLDLSAMVGQDPASQLQQQFTAQTVDWIASLASGVPDLGSDFAVGFGSTVALSRGRTLGIAPTVVGLLNAAQGFFRDFVSDVTRQKGELIETPIRTLTETKSIMNDIISAQNANPAESTLNLEAFNQQLQLIDNEFLRLQDLTSDDINMFLGVNGINQLQEYEVYYTEGGERDRQMREMQLALANPDPANIRVGGSTLKQLKLALGIE